MIDSQFVSYKGWKSVLVISYVLYTVVPRNQAPGFSYKVENGSQTKAIIGKAIYALQ